MRIQLVLLAFLGSAAVAHAAAPAAQSKGKPTLTALGQNHLAGVKKLIASARKGTLVTETANPVAGRVNEHVGARIIYREDILAASKKMSISPWQSHKEIAGSLGLTPSELTTLRYSRRPEMQYATRQVTTSTEPSKLYDSKAIAVKRLLDEAKGSSTEARQIRSILGNATSSPAALAKFMHESRKLYGSNWAYGPRRELFGNKGDGSMAPPEARQRVYNTLLNVIRGERENSFAVSEQMDALFAKGVAESQSK